MSRTTLSVLAALGLFILSGCDRDPELPREPVQPGSASRPAGDGVAPDMHAIVAREGDHLFVIVDIAPEDAQGRKVERASVELEGATTPVTASRPTTRADRLTIELRVPAGTPDIKLVGTSEGGVPWSNTISMKLDD